MQCFCVDAGVHSRRSLQGRRRHEQATIERGGSFGIPRIAPAVPDGNGRAGGGSGLQHDACEQRDAGTGGVCWNARDGGVDDRS